MERVLVIGAPGSGKSTLATQIGAVLQVPVIHLDQHFWHPGWIASSEDEWAATVEALAAKPQWVIEGNYGATMPARLARAECVIFLDIPRLTAFWRTVRRSLTQLGKIRPDSAPGCPERLSLAFWLFAWSYKKRRMPQVESLVVASGVPIVRLQSRHDIAQWLASLKPSPARPA